MIMAKSSRSLTESTCERIVLIARHCDRQSNSGLGSRRDEISRHLLPLFSPPWLIQSTPWRSRDPSRIGKFHGFATETAERSAIRQEYARPTVEVFQFEECAERSHPHGAVRRVTLPVLDNTCAH